MLSAGERKHHHKKNEDYGDDGSGNQVLSLDHAHNTENSHLPSHGVKAALPITVLPHASKCDIKLSSCCSRWSCSSIGESFVLRFGDLKCCSFCRRTSTATKLLEEACRVETSSLGSSRTGSTRLRKNVSSPARYHILIKNGCLMQGYGNIHAVRGGRQGGDWSTGQGTDMQRH